MIKPFSTTGIGSMPHRESFEACELIISSFDIPFWPQLPKYSSKELMIPQFSEGFLGIVVEGDKFYLKKDEELITEWLINYSEHTESPISKEFASGIYKMREILRTKKVEIFKGQITGPLTFSLSLKDEEGKPVYFDETLRELILMHLKAKANWQFNFLKTFSENVIIFIDEPILQTLGTSAYISVEQAEAIRLIEELASYIKNLGTKVGLHCCGRADWREILNLSIDILSFDAYFFFDFFKIYKEEINNFLTKDRYIAWGFVPTTDDLRELNDEKIITTALLKIEEIGKEIPLIYQKSLLTPSCGMGSLDEKDSLRVCSILKSLKSRF